MSQLFGMDLFHLNNQRVNQADKETVKTERAKNTIGKPKLSEDASSYYEELKAKYGDVEFVLVEDSQTANAKDYASNLSSDKSLIVFISESEVEAMATDEDVRTKNEQLITDAKTQMPDLLEQIKEAGADVNAFGFELRSDGSTSYFAVLEKTLEAQKEHTEEKRTVVSASSMEDLIKKIKDTLYEAKADSVMTEQEKMVGQHLDLKF